MINDKIKEKKVEKMINNILSQINNNEIHQFYRKVFQLSSEFINYLQTIKEIFIVKNKLYINNVESNLFHLYTPCNNPESSVAAAGGGGNKNIVLGMNENSIFNKMKGYMNEYKNIIKDKPQIIEYEDIVNYEKVKSITELVMEFLEEFKENTMNKLVNEIITNYYLIRTRKVAAFSGKEINELYDYQFWKDGDIKKYLIKYYNNYFRKSRQLLLNKKKKWNNLSSTQSHKLWKSDDYQIYSSFDVIEVFQLLYQSQTIKYIIHPLPPPTNKQKQENIAVDTIVIDFFHLIVGFQNASKLLVIKNKNEFDISIDLSNINEHIAPCHISINASNPSDFIKTIKCQSDLSLNFTLPCEHAINIDQHFQSKIVRIGNYSASNPMQDVMKVLHFHIKGVIEPSKYSISTNHIKFGKIEMNSMIGKGISSEFQIINQCSSTIPVQFSIQYP